MILQSLPVYEFKHLIKQLDYQDICKLLRVSKYLANIVRLFIQDNQNLQKDKMLGHFLEHIELREFPNIEIFFHVTAVDIVGENCVVEDFVKSRYICLQKDDMGYSVRVGFTDYFVQAAFDIDVRVSDLEIRGEMITLGRNPNTEFLTKIEKFAMEKSGFAMAESDKHLFVHPKGEVYMVFRCDQLKTCGNMKDALDFLDKNDILEVKLRVCPTIVIDDVFSIGCGYFNVIHSMRAERVNPSD